MNEYTMCLNPCFNGLLIQRYQRMTAMQAELGLNLCFNGLLIQRTICGSLRTEE